jgi:hypothetical protein
MRVIKLDGRYAHSNNYKYALQFSGRTAREIRFNTERKEYAKVFEKLCGPESMNNPDYDSTRMNCSYTHIRNPQWFFDRKHNRIYFQEESILSMVLLMIPTSA